MFSTRTFAAVILVLVLSFTNQAFAQVCGKDYTVKEGDTLQRLAQVVYNNPGKWTYIFYANQDRVGSLLKPGQLLRIPCIDGAKRKAARAPVNANAAARRAGSRRPASIALSSSIRRISFLTADDYRPFTDRSLPNSGMLTDVVVSAMNVLKKETKGRLTFKVNWVNDWAAHLDPLLSSRAFDMGFPWHKPACGNFAALSKTAKIKCQKFFFSEPLFEGLVLFFARVNSDFRFENDRSVKGRNICWPAGWATFFLDRDGRNWTKDRDVILLRPQTLQECFRLVGEGAVDAVIADEFSGRTIMMDMKLSGKIKVIDRPVAIESLHVVVNKSHPKARILVHYINSGIRRLKSNGTYEDIIERHLNAFWAAERTKRVGATASVPAPKAKAPAKKPATKPATKSAKKPVAKPADKPAKKPEPEPKKKAN